MQNHPRTVLLGAQAQLGLLPVCDHYSGTPSRMAQSLQLQAELTQEFGTCVLDVTLDCEDGAPAGGEAEHAALVAELAANSNAAARVAVRVHPLSHPAFANDIATLVGQASHKLRHIIHESGIAGDVGRLGKALRKDEMQIAFKRMAKQDRLRVVMLFKKCNQPLNTFC